jgi:type II secretory pathway pseudopilin PulG
MNRHSTRRAKARGQRGFVLLIALIMLLALTLGALVAMTVESTQIRVAANTANAQVALQKAEQMLTQQELQGLLNNFGVVPQACVTPGAWQTTTCGSSIWPTAAGFVVEQLPSVTKPGDSAAAGSYPGNRTPIYRTTVLQNGTGNTSSAMVQSLIH